MKKEFVPVSDFGKLDIGREDRTGVPEFILCPGKTHEQILNLAEKFLQHSNKVILTKANEETYKNLKGRFKDAVFFGKANIVVIKKRNEKRKTLGRIGILTAGTSDIPVAEEARVIAEELGCEVFTNYDVGVAGIHRLTHALEDLKKNKVDILIVVAGMEGALPSVVAGATNMPVLAVPTSNSNMGFQGIPALLSMLNSCSPGIATFNVNNGFGAAVFAVKILKRIKNVDD